MTTDTIARHLFITGRVQRVSFRAGMAAEARRLGVTGWVRNREDGRVEALLQGPPAGVAEMIGWAHRGSARAHVTAVAVTTVARTALPDFQQRETV